MKRVKAENIALLRNPLPADGMVSVIVLLIAAEDQDCILILIEEQRDVPAADLFSGPMVASRGILPQSWSEEIESDRRSPAALLETFVEDVR